MSKVVAVASSSRGTFEKCSNSSCNGNRRHSQCARSGNVFPSSLGSTVRSSSRLFHRLQQAKHHTADRVVMETLQTKLRQLKRKLRQLKHQLTANLHNQNRRGSRRQFPTCTDMATLPSAANLTALQLLQAHGSALASVASLIDLVRRSEIQYASVIRQTFLDEILDIERGLYPILCDVATALDERHTATNVQVSRRELVPSNRTAALQRDAALISCSRRIVVSLVRELGRWLRIRGAAQ
ncbi:hypothetical protein LSAT2_019621 [Lamellibrachia satsuma]|nr:hypothetical protein LSAT2_019621 [Lamellibrachia satsuma]